MKEKVETINRLMSDATNLYNQGKFSEAEELWKKVRELKDTLNNEVFEKQIDIRLIR